MNQLKSMSIFLCIFFLLSCSKNSSSNSTAIVAVPAIYLKIYGATSITNDGTYITIKTKDLPDHKSPYYPTSNALYEAYSGTTFGGNTFIKNPNSIIEQSGTFKIPVNPKMDASHSATPCLLYTSPSPRDRTRSRMPSSA